LFTQLHVTFSLMYPYVSPVLTVMAATERSDGPSRDVPVATVAALEAVVNVSVLAQYPEDPLPAQLAQLCSAAATAVRALPA
jgi:hypothetical protein